MTSKITKVSKKESAKFIRAYYLGKSKKWAGLKAEIRKGKLIIKGAL